MTNPSQQFDSLHQKFNKLVVSIASKTLRRSAEAEDVAQQVWTEAWIAIQQGQTLTKGWLTICAQRRAWDRREQLAGDPDSLDALVEDAAEEEDGSVMDRLQFRAMTHATGGLDAHLIDYIRQAVDNLTPAVREAVNLHYYAGRSIQEIAVELGVPVGTVKRRLHDGRLALQAALLPSNEKEAA